MAVLLVKVKATFTIMAYNKDYVWPF